MEMRVCPAILPAANALGLGSSHRRKSKAEIACRLTTTTSIQAEVHDPSILDPSPLGHPDNRRKSRKVSRQSRLQTNKRGDNVIFLSPIYHQVLRIHAHL
jgi:hypothetical protein